MVSHLTTGTRLVPSDGLRAPPRPSRKAVQGSNPSNHHRSGHGHIGDHPPGCNSEGLFLNSSGTRSCSCRFFAVSIDWCA